MWNNKCFLYLDYFNLNKEINIYILLLFDVILYLLFFKYFYFEILNDVVEILFIVWLFKNRRLFIYNLFNNLLVYIFCFILIFLFIRLKFMYFINK